MAYGAEAHSALWVAEGGLPDRVLDGLLAQMGLPLAPHGPDPTAHLSLRLVLGYLTTTFPLHTFPFSAFGSLYDVCISPLLSALQSSSTAFYC